MASNTANHLSLEYKTENELKFAQWAMREYGMTNKERTTHTFKGQMSVLLEVWNVVDMITLPISLVSAGGKFIGKEVAKEVGEELGEKAVKEVAEEAVEKTVKKETAEEVAENTAKKEIADTAEDLSQKTIDKDNVFRDSGIIEESSVIQDVRNINGQRTSRYKILTDEEITSIMDDIDAIGADPAIFRFNEGNQTGFLDSEGIINIRGDILPNLNSTHPRDLMSQRAVLAHEYYGHKYFDDVFGARNSAPGSWNDEFRASYNAAINTPNLSDMDRMYLMLDALERAKETGVNIKMTEQIRRILYGY